MKKARFTEEQKVKILREAAIHRWQLWPRSTGSVLV